MGRPKDCCMQTREIDEFQIENQEPALRKNAEAFDIAKLTQLNQSKLEQVSNNCKVYDHAHKQHHAMKNEAYGQNKTTADREITQR